MCCNNTNNNKIHTPTRGTRVSHCAHSVGSRCANTRECERKHRQRLTLSLSAQGRPAYPA